MCKEESPVCFVVQVRLVSISRPSFPKIKLKDIDTGIKHDDSGDCFIVAKRQQ